VSVVEERVAWPSCHPPGSVVGVDSAVGGRCDLCQNLRMTIVTPASSTFLPLPPVTPAQGYAGDVSPEQAWQWVCAGEAVLVDVRTDAERAWVGSVPGAVPVAWKQWPGMVTNAAFDAEVLGAGAPGQKLVLLCRSGVRSVAAARRATELGLLAYNVLEGFEGDADTQGHRGQLGGWRLRGLPWQQG